MKSDCGEGGGRAHLATPETYPRLYTYTVAAIVRADPTAHVGGPGLGYRRSPILPALLANCAEQEVPLHFVSWHIYTSNPQDTRATIEHVRELLAQYPALHPETILDEWNLALQPDAAARDPRFQPCYIPEVAWQMKEAGLDYSCYYQIRDYHVNQREFARFFTSHGAAFMARWWNRMPQWDGLFDYQNTVRPSYFTFKLLSCLAGQRLRIDSFVPDAVTASNDENYRIRMLKQFPLEGRVQLEVACEPYGVHFCYFMPTVLPRPPRDLSNGRYPDPPPKPDASTTLDAAVRNIAPAPIRGRSSVTAPLEPWSRLGPIAPMNCITIGSRMDAVEHLLACSICHFGPVGASPSNQQHNSRAARTTWQLCSSQFSGWYRRVISEMYSTRCVTSVQVHSTLLRTTSAGTGRRRCLRASNWPFPSCTTRLLDILNRASSWYASAASLSVSKGKTK